MTISTLLCHVEHGQLKLPCFARDYVWKPSQIIRLIDSLYRGYPVGTLILWTPCTATTPQQSKMVKHTQPVQYIVDGQQRITVLYGVARGEPAPFRAALPSPVPPLYFHVEKQEFAFQMPSMKNDSLWINLPDFFNQKEPRVGEFLGPLFETPCGRARIGEYALRLNRLGGVLNRDLGVEYLSGDASSEEAAEVYILANGGN